MVVEPKESSILRLNEGVNAALSFSFQDEKFFLGRYLYNLSKELINNKFYIIF
jgi:hypothetical protein